MNGRKITYELDPHNRLILRSTGKKSKIPKYRQIIDGKFRIGKGNSLTYHVKKSRDFDTPQQIKFSGNWSLDKNHDLVFTLNKWGNQVAGNKLTLTGNIMDVKRNKLLFAVITKTPDSRARIYILRLLGSWQADKHNKLTFDLKRKKGPYDTLVIKGIWEINRQNKLVYKYVKKDLKGGQKRTHLLIFKGRLKIADKFRLSYALTGEDTGLARKTITITGRWKIDKKKGLLFEVKYEKGRICAIVFGATFKLSKRNNLKVRLKNRKGKNLGIELILSKKLLKSAGEAFFKTLFSKKEFILFAGTGIKW